MSQKISCEKCGSSTKLMTVLPRFGSQPQYRLFECDACGAVTWSADSESAAQQQQQIQLKRPDEDK